MRPYYSLELYQEKLDNINKWCEEKGLSENDLETAHNEYRSALQYIRRHKNTLSNNDSRMKKRNEIIKRNKVYSTHFRTKQDICIKIEKLNKMITINNDNSNIRNNDMIGNGRYNSIENTEEIYTNEQV